MLPGARLAELGIELPEPPTLPFAPRLAKVVVHGGVAYVSGDGDLSRLGRVGGDVGLVRAATAARTTVHLMCRRLRAKLGSIDRVDRWPKVLVLVRSAPALSEQPAVANGFTDAVAELWGEGRGVCARSAVGVAELPGGLAIGAA